MNRRNAVIKALAAVMAAFGGQRVGAQDAPKTGPVSEAVGSYSQRSSHAAILTTPFKTGMTFNLDYSTGITLSLGGESIHLSPEEIMEALRS